MSTDVGTLILGVTADISKLGTGLDQAQNKIAAAGKSMMKAGGVLTAGVTAPLIGIGAASIAAATQFDESMANVQTLLTDMADGGSARTAELANAVQSMAIATGKSTEDLAGGMYQVISAFGDGADTVAMLEINAKAAAAGLATTTEAINLTAAVTKGYGDVSAESVQKASDLAFMAVKLGQTSFPELAASIGRVAGTSAQLGVSQEELFAVMATATGVTGGAAEVSTQLAAIYSSLLAPTGDLSALYEEMGVASGAALIEQKGLQGAIADIVAAADAAGEPLQKYLGSVEGQRLATTLAGAQADTYADKLAQMGDAAGAADAAFGAITEGVNANGFAMQVLQQQMAVVAQELGAALVPALSAALTAAQPLIDKVVALAMGFQTLSPQQQRMILGATALAAALGPVLMAVGAMVTAFGAIAPVVGAVGAALGALISPIGLVAGLIVGLAAVLFDWGGANEKVAETLENWGLEGAADFVRQLHEGVEQLTEGIGALFSGETSFTDFFEASIPDWIKTLFDWAWPLLGPIAWIVKLTAWAWPTLSQPGWIDNLLSFSWPSFPSRPSWLPGGGGGDDGTPANSWRGQSYWRGGLTWVGEKGPELMQLPRGTRIWSHDDSLAMMSGRQVEINNYNTVHGETDIQQLAYMVARELRRARR